MMGIFPQKRKYSSMHCIQFAVGLMINIGGFAVLMHDFLY
jgi:hypothetical protein